MHSFIYFTLTEVAVSLRKRAADILIRNGFENARI
jgi:hypothetical protein